MFVCLFVVVIVVFFFFFQAVIVDYFREQCTLYTVHGTHKLHFSAIFSLKIGLTILFTHYKLFCYSIFSFQLYPNGS